MSFEPLSNWWLERLLKSVFSTLSMSSIKPSGSISIYELLAIEQSSNNSALLNVNLRSLKNGN